ncbi:MAG: hypothetical protein K0R00_4134 [Herbinix sp.]|nr:hypothetical protein [Herbinix sp.]
MVSTNRIGVQKREGQAQAIELGSKDRNHDYRDLNNSGSIQDEVQKTEQKNNSMKAFDFSNEGLLEIKEDNYREEQGFFDED